VLDQRPRLGGGSFGSSQALELDALVPTPRAELLHILMLSDLEVPSSFRARRALLASRRTSARSAER
jgi:hypothetical protein